MLERSSWLAWAVTGCLAEYVTRAARGGLNEQTRAGILHKWCARFVPRIGVQLQVSGALPERGLLLSNHLSYLDVLVFSSIAPCVFVAKTEVQSWPAVGQIAWLAGSVFIDRSRRSQAHALQPAMERALRNGSRLVLFPEGTSSDGQAVLPFHSSLIQPAVSCRAPITTAHVSYGLADGDPRREVCYWGDMTLVPHLLRLLTKEIVTARIRFGETRYVFANRKEAAQQLRQEVAALGGDPER